jgi:hypothetical protein
MRYLRIISVFLATTGAVAVVVWLVVQNLAPAGVYVARWLPDRPNALIGPLVPESRLLPLGMAADGTLYRSLVEEPINFNVRLPSTFKTAEVAVKYAGDAKVVELGGLVSRETWSNDLRPGQNLAIANSGWEKVEEKGTALYQREKKYRTLSEFYENPPASGVAVYRADYASAIKIPGYVPSANESVYRTAYRGAASLRVYLKNEKLNIRWRVQEVNRHLGSDSFTATAFLGKERVAFAAYADDGNDQADGKLSGFYELRLSSDRPLTGIVRIDLPAADDVIFRETITPHAKFVFGGRFYAADNVGYLNAPAAFSLVTNGRRVYATTAHPEAFQEISAGGNRLTVDDVNKRYSISVADSVRQIGLAEIKSPYGDLRLETAGFFAFTKQNFFNAEPQALTWESDLDKDNIDYILTSYVPPKGEGEWKTISATYDLSRLSTFGRAVNFTVSAPGLELQQKELRLAEIVVTFRRDPLGARDLFPALIKFFRQITGREKEISNGLKN